MILFIIIHIIYKSLFRYKWYLIKSARVFVYNIEYCLASSNFKIRLCFSLHTDFFMYQMFQNFVAEIKCYKKGFMVGETCGLQISIQCGTEFCKTPTKKLVRNIDSRGHYRGLFHGIIPHCSRNKRFSWKMCICIILWHF